MKIIEPSFSIETPLEFFEQATKLIEQAGRTCYKSEDKATEGSDLRFIRQIIDSGHESVIEHFSFSVRFICDRGVTHELVRHRLSSFSQESTRYCNYNKGKFGEEITVIRPFFWREGSPEYVVWESSCQTAETNYRTLVSWGCKPQEARSVLPNSLKTEIVMIANLREWRTIFKQRTSHKAHPQMRQVMCPLLDQVKTILPVIFDDIEHNWEEKAE